MREIQSSDAEAHLPQVRQAHRSVSGAVIGREHVRRALDEIAALRQTAGKMTVDEILAARHQDHKY